MDKKDNVPKKIVKKSGGAMKTPGKASGVSKPNKSGETKKSPSIEGVLNNPSKQRLSGKIKIYDKETENDATSIELL